MSVFKTQGIILNQKKIKDKEFIYTLFTKDFWKICANKKFSSKEKNLDIGYIINCEIETKQNREIHKIKNIKIKYEFLNQKRNFSEINLYLELLGYINKNLGDGIIVPEIYTIFETINKASNINENKLILTKLKLKNILWELPSQNKNPTLTKILKFIHNNPIQTILKLKIDKNIKDELKKI